MNDSQWPTRLCGNISGLAPNLPTLLTPLYQIFQQNEHDNACEVTEPPEAEGIQAADHDEFDALVSEIVAVHADYVDQVAPQVANVFADSMFHERVELYGFLARLRRRWGLGLRKLALVGQVAVEIGAEINAVSSRDGMGGALLTSLTSLHARGCQVFKEIHLLLSHGFSEGADARWRTLHELAVTALFIAQNGDEMAVRYLEHDAIEVAKGSEEYEQCYSPLGFQPLGENNVRSAKERAARLVEKYGENFSQPFGWACSVVKDVGRPGFASIERAVNLQHFRPLYRGSSHNVHAPSRRVFHSNMSPAGTPQVLATGPGNYGLADPGQNAAISLVQLTACFLWLYGKEVPIDVTAALAILGRLSDSASSALLDAHQQLEREIAEDTGANKKS